MYASSGAGGGRPDDSYKKKMKNASITNIPPEVIAELVGSPPSEKNWKGVVIALAVIASILAMITAAILLLTPRSSEFILGDRITFQEAMTFPHQLRKLQYQWLLCDGQDTLLYLNATSGDIMQLSFSSRNGSARTSRFLSKDRFSEGRIEQFKASPDCKHLLIPVNMRKRFRHSFSSQFKVVRVTGSDTKEEAICLRRPCAAAAERLQIADWGHDRAFLTFVHDGDIYFAEDPLRGPAVRVTDNQRNPRVSCGVADWVYEEEILQTSRAFWVSPGNERIAFLVFNNSQVPEYDLPWYGSPASMYLQQKRIPYPKAGARAPIVQVSLQSYSLRSRTVVALPPPPPVPQEHYVTDVRWFNSSHLLATWVDRPQTRAFLGICDCRTAVCSLFYSSKQTGGWADFNKQISTEPLVDARNARIFVVLHNLGFRRIAAVRVDGVNQVAWVTPNLYDVADILHYDSSSNQLHFLSCREDEDAYDATKMHVHRILAAEDAAPATCVTCSGCEFSAASFSGSGRLMLHECLGPRPFRYTVRACSHADAYRELVTVEDNSRFAALLRNKNLPRVEFRKLRLRAATTPQARAEPLEVNAKLVLPRQLNQSHSNRYPLVLKVYAGPHWQLATRKFEFGWQQYLASSLFIASASVDGRGTANRGSEFLFSVKNRLAAVELQDQMDALAELKRLSFVNGSSVAAFGWSYGGFAALHLLAHAANANATVCAAAAAVAPVTDFHYYNSGYTERYLGIKTEETAANYKRTNVSALAHNFWNKDLLLAHGTGDDNVHYQNTAQLVKALVKENIDFELATYPDDAHGLQSSQLHLYQKITTFLLNSFNRTSERKRFLNSKDHRFCIDSVQAVC